MKLWRRRPVEIVKSARVQRDEWLEWLLLGGISQSTVYGYKRMTEKLRVSGYRLFCKVGWHRWDDLPTSRWLDEPRPSENRLGTALEYRTCHHCSAVTDTNAFLSSRDPDLGVPNGMGRLASKRVREIMAQGRTPLSDPPLPLGRFDA